MTVPRTVQLRHAIPVLILGSALLHLCCDEVDPLPPPVAQCSEVLSQSDVESILAHAVEQAQRLTQRIHVAVCDREGNILGVFAMTGSTGSAPVAFTRARTAAFLSSNQHAFTTLTACFITRPHFPPGVFNTAAGPLYGVGFSSLPGGDIQPNGSALNDRPGGVPIYKNGCLAGGIGVSGATSAFDSSLCSGGSLDEVIALGGVLDFPVPAEKRGDNIFIDGIRFLYANSSVPPGNYTLTFAGLGTLGTVVSGFPPQSAPAQRFPFSGEVNLDVSHDFRIRGGAVLSSSDVRQIIQQAAAQAGRTRAAIRQPLGVAAQVFIAVVDTNGAVLGIWRTPDATLFSFDVAAQKARTALAFSNPNMNDFGRRLRIILGLSSAVRLAMTTRAVGFLAQEYFPPGIDRSTLGNPPEPGPLFEGTDFAYQRRLLSLAGLPPYGNGITIFPGGIPLYKNGQLVGAIGVSGDGVDQDDLIAYVGSHGFEPDPEIRSDRFFYHDVRLPYVKVPRQPEL